MADFVDTNILLYTISSDPAEESKRRIAQSILERTDCVLSVQVLQEFYYRATTQKKSRGTSFQPISPRVAEDLIATWLRFRVESMTVAMVQKAMKISQTSILSYWDSALIVAAEQAGCQLLITEDLNHSQVIGTIRIHNPFV